MARSLSWDLSLVRRRWVSDGRGQVEESPYLELEGEALDHHMMAMHGWSMQMVAVKSVQTLAQKYNYIGDLHRKEHYHPSHVLPVDKD